MLLYVDPSSLASFVLADDGQGDLFHPHRNHLAAFFRDRVYYQVTPDFYAYLRHNRETLRAKAAAGSIFAAEFEAKDHRFLAIRDWALKVLGEIALKAAVIAFDAKKYKAPAGLYRPAAGEMLPAPFDAPPPEPETIEITAKPESLPPAPPAQNMLLVKTEKGTWIQETTIPNDPKRDRHLTPAPPAGAIPIKSPEVRARCEEIVRRVLDEIGRIYIASEGFLTPFCWARDLAQAGDKAAADLLREAKTAEENLDKAAGEVDLEATEKAATLYLYHWRKLIYRYDDHVAEMRRKAKE